MDKQIKQLSDLILKANKIVIIQADNPDADSLGSALALEQILEDMGKQTYLYCGVTMPTYLRYMNGWDRVVNELPANFDASILVDASTMSLLEKMVKNGHKGILASKVFIAIDHHEKVENIVPFAELIINDYTKSSAGELIYFISKELKWPINIQAMEFIINSILGDTQGLTNQMATAETYRIMADMIEAGIDRSSLEEVRREYGKMPPVIFKYKADLIKRTELDHDGQIALVTISQDEINTYSPLYNPAPLIQNDMLQTLGVKVAIVLKHYDDGKVTGAIRANNMAPIAASLAEHFNGGGHRYASGFKIENAPDFSKVKEDCISFASKLLDDLN